jgi:hypothetical protein
MAKLISEPIAPIAGSADPMAMVRGEPGLPEGFVWRDRPLRIAEVRETWKRLRPESAGGELYLRRHYYRLRMDDGREWIVYCLRHASRRPGAGNPARRWYLYSIAGPDIP